MGSGHMNELRAHELHIAAVINNRPDLDRNAGEAERRPLLDDGDGGVQVWNVDDAEPADILLGFGEWPSTTTGAPPFGLALTDVAVSGPCSSAPPSTITAPCFSNQP